jgi:arsenite/tail-anchored protein-transporting ATPase
VGPDARRSVGGRLIARHSIEERSLGGRPVLFVGGKGGVGKTTTAAALGMALAGRGERVLLVSTDPAHSLGDLFQRVIGADETEIWRAGGGAPGVLAALELDAEAETERYLDGVRDAMRAFVRPALYPEIERQIALTRHTPGAAEAALMDRMAALLSEGPAHWDRVIFDTAPTGHTLRLLQLPELMAAWTDGLLHQRERSDRLTRILKGGERGERGESGDASASVESDAPAESSAPGESDAPAKSRTSAEPRDDLGILDDGDAGPSDPRLRRLRATLMERRRRFSEARRHLLDPARVGFLFVLTPERLPILETGTALRTLSDQGVSVIGLVVNRVLPDGADGVFIEARRAREAPYLEEIDSTFRTLPRVRVPLDPSDIEGSDRLMALGERVLTGFTT